MQACNCKHAGDLLARLSDLQGNMVDDCHEEIAGVLQRVPHGMAEQDAALLLRFCYAPSVTDLFNQLDNKEMHQLAAAAGSLAMVNTMQGIEHELVTRLKGGFKPFLDAATVMDWAGEADRMQMLKLSHACEDYALQHFEAVCLVCCQPSNPSQLPVSMLESVCKRQLDKRNTTEAELAELSREISSLKELMEQLQASVDKTSLYLMALRNWEKTELYALHKVKQPSTSNNVNRLHRMSYERAVSGIIKSAQSAARNFPSPAAHGL